MTQATRAADISFVADYVPGLDGLGSMGKGAHTPQETVDLATFNLDTANCCLYLPLNAKLDLNPSKDYVGLSILALDFCWDL